MGLAALLAALLSLGLAVRCLMLLHRLVGTGSTDRRRRRQRRRTDWGREFAYLTGLLLVAGSLWAATSADGDATKADMRATLADRDVARALVKLQEGRATSLSVVCGAISAISQQGRLVLISSQLQESPLTRFLEQHGYPSLRARRQKAREEGQAYVAGISQRVNQALKRSGRAPVKGLVRPDGTIDCAVFQSISDSRRIPR